MHGARWAHSKLKTPGHGLQAETAVHAPVLNASVLRLDGAMSDYRLAGASEIGKLREHLLRQASGVRSERDWAAPQKGQMTGARPEHPALVPRLGPGHASQRLPLPAPAEGDEQIYGVVDMSF